MTFWLYVHDDIDAKNIKSNYNHKSKRVPQVLALLLVWYLGCTQTEPGSWCNMETRFKSLRPSDAYMRQ